MRSDKPEAKAFQDWVTREVLPSIRKTLCHQRERKLVKKNTLSQHQGNQRGSKTDWPARDTLRDDAPHSFGLWAVEVLPPY